MARPNILLLFTDQQRWDTIAAAGHPDAAPCCVSGSGNRPGISSGHGLSDRGAWRYWL